MRKFLITGLTAITLLGSTTSAFAEGTGPGGNESCTQHPDKPYCQGEPGKDGTDGKDGADGTDGVDGSKGDKGDDGAKGENGSNGIDGTNGTDGAKGDTGSKGDTGATGATGATGSAGAAGTTTIIRQPVSIVTKWVGNTVRTLHIDPPKGVKVLSVKATLRNKKLPVKGRTITADLRDKPIGNQNVEITVKWRSNKTGKVSTHRYTRNLSVQFSQVAIVG